MNVFKAVLDAIFPENFTCDLCGAEIFTGTNFCEKCAKTVIKNDGHTCPVCGRRTAFPELCLECKAQTPRYDKAVSALVYEEGVKLLIYNYKNGSPYLKDYFARILAEKCAAFQDADSVCYVPMLRKDEGNRGYNQSYLLAKELSVLLKLPLLKKAIEKVKSTSAQKTLTRKERAQNLKSAFKAERSAVEGKKIILVDDVLTTGATADAISGELKRRGAVKVYLATVASVEYQPSEKT